uniref:NADH:ubiquinone reductase (H(+)-translocating) n=1 Tax=Philodina citrina TaxID=468664 RepID=K0J9V1_9BILA|nr:NADH dehydrogenase subunit 5 [Philodina citrina]
MVFIYVVTLMLMFMVFLFLMVFLMNKGMLIISFKLLSVNFFNDLEIMLNMWSFMFLMMVLFITFSVLLFSFSYMSVYPVQNFIMLYLWFVLSMFWLILNNNFYWMMFGWDGLGVVSFLLIIFYMNYESVTNGLFTIFQNRLGDLFFVFFLLMLLSSSISLNLTLKFGLVALVLGACVKSAQFPFNAWLLAAMSAPTPISSLVHSSTLVVAGVYILLQFSYCLLDVLIVLKYISLLTLLISFFGLLNESDMKKLIAYSTMSHVALMMFLMSMQLYKITFFHLNVHAMFKSLMFMCFGFTMLSSYHSQDKRLVSYMMLSPIIKMIYYFACFCLMGLPFLSGFFSKDFIIEKTMENNSEMSNIFLLLLFLSVSIYYSMKLFQLFRTMYVLSVVEMQISGMFGLLVMMSLSVLIINVFISMVFSVSLEILSYKMMIYLLIFMFLLLSLLTNLNYKWMSYHKILSNFELWNWNWYSLDQFMFSNMFYIVDSVVKLAQVKYILLVNWWVMVLVIVFFKMM